MKRLNSFVGLLIFSLALSACSSAAATGPTTQATNDTPDARPGGALSTEMQLAVGTLLLDESGQPISAEKAAELLPLWKAVRSLGSSSTISSQEFQALFDQIKDTLTPEQMDAITGMELTRDDLMALSEKLGISLMGGGGPMGTRSAEMLETLQAARESGQMPEMPSGNPGGGFPGGGGGMPAGGGGGMPAGGGGGMPAGGGSGMGPGMAGDMLPEEASTASGRVRGGVTQNIPTELLDTVIKFLQAKVEG